MLSTWVGTVKFFSVSVLKKEIKISSLVIKKNQRMVKLGFGLE